MDSQSSVIDVSDFLSAKSGSASTDFAYLNYQFPFIALGLYVLSKPLLQFMCRSMKTTGESAIFRAFVVLHNIALCLYSLWTAVGIWSIMISSYQRRGFMATYCDYDNEMWNQGLGAFGYYFYLSKIWEFVDTAVLIVKQKEVSLLQFYHHCGALISMWMFVVSRSPQTQVFVSLNSVIHTIMYAYFTASALRMKFPMSRSSITQLQLAQFFVGLALGMPILFAQFGIDSFGRTSSFWIGPKCDSPAAAAATIFGFAYLFPLVFLFIQFYISNYVSPKGASGQSAKKRVD